MISFYFITDVQPTPAPTGNFCHITKMNLFLTEIDLSSVCLKLLISLVLNKYTDPLVEPNTSEVKKQTTRKKEELMMYIV